jgi:adenine deaminase
MSALRAATADSARYLGLHHTMGTVRAGNVADLVVLDADPLADIRNTQRINAVVTKGRLLRRSRLDTMLAEVERAAAEPLFAVDGFAAGGHSAGRTPAAALGALNRCC